MDTLRHYTKVLDNLIDKYDYWKLFFLNPYSRDEDWSDGFGVDVCCGATRCAIVDNDCDTIVKFNVDSDGVDDDICAREAHFYRNAKEWGLQDCFAKVEFIGYYERDIWFYDLQEVQHLIYEYIEDFDDKLRAEIDENGLSVQRQHICLPLYAAPRADFNFNLFQYTKEENVRDFVDSVSSPLKDRNKNVAFIFVKEYGEDTYVELSNFLDMMHINDLHSGNIGIVNGKMVLIDYAGYFEENEYDSESY